MMFVNCIAMPEINGPLAPRLVAQPENPCHHQPDDGRDVVTIIAQGWPVGDPDRTEIHRHALEQIEKRLPLDLVAVDGPGERGRKGRIAQNPGC